MEKKKLCPVCQTGADAYILDPREPMCPYLSHHNGIKCDNYKKMTGGDKKCE